MLKELLEQNYAEIGRADGKAGMLLALTVSLVGLLLTGQEHQHRVADLLQWTAVAASSAALLSVLMALLPRRGAPEGGRGTLAYFEDVLRASRRAQLAAAVNDSGTAPRARLLRAVEGTSRIAHAKNRFIRLSIVLLVPAIASSLGVLLIR
ncbi:hypothetical protein KSNIM_05655 [Kitasatospora sp. DSM 101779]|nr:hypothetical protein [Kitasatospora sp. DSM 101779]